MTSPVKNSIATDALGSVVTKLLGSPKNNAINTNKRKTVVVAEDGTKKLVDTNKFLSHEDICESTNKKHFSRRHGKSKEKISDVFGDFFGFGPNPPGVMSKGAPTVNFKGEKEKFI